MPEGLVVDASIAIAIVQDEPVAAGIRAALNAKIEAGSPVFVPGHFWLEVLNVLVRRYGQTPADVLEALSELDHLVAETIEVDRPLLLLALDHATAQGLSAYDAAYPALAESIDGQLMTLDDRLAAAAGWRAMPPSGSSGRLSEPAAAYGSDGPMTTWAGYGAYLAELRVRAAR